KYTPATAVFVSNNDPLVYLYTGRHGLQPSPYQGWRVHSANLITPASLVWAIKESGASYVLVDPSYQAGYLVYAQLGIAVAGLQKVVPNLLSLKYMSPRGVMIIFEVNPQALGEALAKFPPEGEQALNQS